ncbi:hypothetical protein [Rhodococcus sp. YH3-3]
MQEDIFDEFLAMAAIRTKAVRQGDPLDTDTMQPAYQEDRVHR